jgi:hypothetical protein
MLATLVGVICFFHVVLICFFLGIHNVEAPFHVFTSYWLIFFEEMPVQVLCPLSNQAIYIFVFVLWEFYIQYGN